MHPRPKTGPIHTVYILVCYIIVSVKLDFKLGKELKKV